MAAKPSDILKKGLKVLENQVRTKEMLQAQLAKRKSISSQDKQWLDHDVNLVDELQVLEALENASDYERAFKGLDSTCFPTIKIPSQMLRLSSNVLSMTWKQLVYFNATTKWAVKPCSIHLINHRWLMGQQMKKFVRLCWQPEMHSLRKGPLASMVGMMLLRTMHCLNTIQHIMRCFRQHLISIGMLDFSVIHLHVMLRQLWPHWDARCIWIGSSHSVIDPHPCHWLP